MITNHAEGTFESLRYNLGICVFLSLRVSQRIIHLIRKESAQKRVQLRCNVWDKSVMTSDYPGDWNPVRDGLRIATKIRLYHFPCVFLAVESGV